MDERLLTLERNRLFRLWNKIYRAGAGIYGRLGIGTRFGGLSDLRTPGDYQRWCDREQQEMAAQDPARLRPEPRPQPLISVEITDGAGAADSLRSVIDQCYANWQVTVPEGVPSPRGDKRVVESPTGDYLLRLHAGDRLSPHALHFYAQAQGDDSPDVLYSDEDVLGRDGSRTAPVFKPGWSPELLRSTMYLGRAVMYRRGVSRTLTPDLAAGLRVRHVPRALYHRAASTPPEYAKPAYTAPPGSRLTLIICTRQLRQLRECVQAVRYTASLPLDVLVVHHLGSGAGDDVRRYVEESGGTWIAYRGPFDFARMNNLAARKAAPGDMLLFLNDDVIVHERGWDQAMAATLARPEIGIAGAILQYPNGAVQHAGVVTGMGDAVGHCGRFQMSSELWPWLRMGRDVTAVTGAMLGIRAEVFTKLRGFDETFPVNYNDVDLCLRVKEAGLRVVCLDLGKVVHRESQTRIGGTRHEEREELYNRWAEVLARPDEFYSPHLAPTERIALNTGRRPLASL